MKNTIIKYISLVLILLGIYAFFLIHSCMEAELLFYDLINNYDVRDASSSLNYTKKKGIYTIRVEIIENGSMADITVTAYLFSLKLSTFTGSLFRVEELHTPIRM